VGTCRRREVERFREESGAFLAALGPDVNVYVQIAISLAEGASDNECYELCMRRSVIQSLLEDYAGTPVPGLIDPVDLADLDTEMRRVGEQQGPVPTEWVPRGLPGSHWWWTYLGILKRGATLTSDSRRRPVGRPTNRSRDQVRRSHFLSRRERRRGATRDCG
jgi:hypothetical protein